MCVWCGEACGPNTVNVPVSLGVGSLHSLSTHLNHLQVAINVMSYGYTPTDGGLSQCQLGEKSCLRLAMWPKTNDSTANTELLETRGGPRPPGGHQSAASRLLPETFSPTLSGCCFMKWFAGMMSCSKCFLHDWTQHLLCGWKWFIFLEIIFRLSVWYPLAAPPRPCGFPDEEITCC